MIIGACNVDGMAELQRAILAACADAGSYRALSRRARNMVSASTLNNLVLGRHSGRMKSEQLDGLALAIGLPAAAVASMLGQPYTDPAKPFVLPERAHRLTQPQRKVVVSVVDAILSASESSSEVQAPPANLKQRIATDRTVGTSHDKEAPLRDVARRGVIKDRDGT